MIATEDEEILSVDEFLLKLRAKTNLRPHCVSRKAQIGRFSLRQLLRGRTCHIETFTKIVGAFGGKVEIKIPNRKVIGGAAQPPNLGPNDPEVW